MRNPLPMPAIPRWLGADNTVDLDALGSSSLETFVDVEGLNLADGTLIYPNWRGCGALGEGYDDVDSQVAYDSRQLTPDGFPITFANAELKRLDQGTVFYSFSYQIGTGNSRSEESLRRFFYVGKRAAWVPLLPVVQVREAHNLHLDPDGLPEDVSEFTAVIVPYENMRPGDVVEFIWAGYRENGDAVLPVSAYKTVIENKHIGQVLEFPVPRAKVLIILKGRVELSYTVTYADGARPVTVSPMQTLYISPPSPDKLPAIVIPGVDDYLDPGQYLNGLQLTISNYPRMLPGDSIVVSAIAPRLGVSKIIALTVDQTIVDRGFFNVFYEYEWLNSNSNLAVRFSYQFSRLNANGSSEPLEVNISKARKLEEYPYVPEATPEAPGIGKITAKRAVRGVAVSIPDSVELFGSDKTQVRCNEDGQLGFYLGASDGTSQRELNIPMCAVAPNAGKSVAVYYQVIVDGVDEPLVSPAYTLEISPLLPTDITPVQCTKPESSGNLSKSEVQSAGGAEFTQSKWPYFLQGQRVKVIAIAGAQTHFLRGTEADGEPVSESEYDAGYIKANLANEIVQALAVSSKLSVRAYISLDGGVSYIATVPAELTIVT